MATPVVASGAPPTSEVRSVASWAGAKFGATHKASRCSFSGQSKTGSDSARHRHTRPVHTCAQAEYSPAEVAGPLLIWVAVTVNQAGTF